MLVDLQDNSADGSTQMDLDLDSEELAAIPVSSDHDESLPLLPPLPPIPPQLTQSGRPQRNYRLPKRFQDNLPRPEAPLPAVETEPPNSETATHTGIRRVTLIVRDHLVTALNAFGLWRDYPERPTFDPDSSLTLEDLATPRDKSHPSTPLISNDSAFSVSVAGARPAYWPFPNPTIHGVLKWLNNGKTVKSEAEMTHFVHDVILSPEFKATDLIGFDAHRENQRLDAALSKDALRGQFNESVVEILVLSGDTSTPPCLFSVPGLLHRKLTSVIQEAFTGSLSHLFHFSPFKLFHKSPITGEDERVYGEIYTSDAFLNETEKVHRHGQLPPDDPGCVREKVVAAVMFASDATQLTQFGDTKAWPIYFMPGNLSKYVRAKPDSGGLIHLAYIPVVSI
jgi:hypothetical protein